MEPGADAHFDEAVVGMCDGPTIDLGCGPGRLVAHLIRRGVPALGVDLSPAAIGLARRSGAPALRRDVFGPLPGTGRWHTVLLADGNVGLGGDPWRVLRRAAELLRQGGRCRRGIRFHRNGCQRRLGAPGVPAKHRPVVPVGISGHRLCGHAGPRGRPDDGRRAPDRRPGGRDNGGDVRAASPRGTAVTARVGAWLGIAIAVCFVTGLISHFIQHPQPWFFWPTRPVWLYRLTQGLHVVSGIAAIPLLVVKLWSVWPKLFERPLIGGLTRQLERGSILVLVASMIFQLSTGLMNIAQWYAFRFFFTTSHYAMAYVAAGAVLVHIAVKLPVIRRALGEPVDDGSPVGPSRRAVLRGTGLAVGLATVVTAGQAVPLLRGLSVLAPRSGEGPQGVPVNRSAIAAGVMRSARSPDYRLTVANGPVSRDFSLAELAALPQSTRTLPIACVEGWSVSAEWTGVVLADLVAAAGGSADADVRMVSLEPPGPYSRTVLPARHARDRQTLIALTLNGHPLDLDHGYPCRLIAPARPGVLQTKWLSRVEVIR